ncbi:hypothetical protein N7461_003797 [Penicillium sp. DV-2018c]|nr:hypothetical protein N7461_003797 [Penicillium sp. DV-2018c]
MIQRGREESFSRSDMENLNCDPTGLSLDAGDLADRTDPVNQTHLASSRRSDLDKKQDRWAGRPSTHHTRRSWDNDSDTDTDTDNAAVQGSTGAGNNNTNAQRTPINVARLVEGPGAPYVVDIPLESDNLETAAKKMETIAEIIVAGGRLDIRIRPRQIVHTQWAWQHARERMRGEELSHFNAWAKRCLSIPSFDWSNELPFNEEAGEAFRKYAQAMDLILSGCRPRQYGMMRQ